MGVRAHVVRHRLGQARATSLQRFTPDFYLPEYDLYIEITTLNQKLVTKKNRKVRRLRERYPEITCKIFYQRDYLSLVTKYGLEDASETDQPAHSAVGPYTSLT